ncbi:MAG TPA: glycosyl hydrolase 115 family protein [Candidatus Gallimonas intestinavium]|uniref:Glycosyl hydrolase 115 family protein n=1 Tax=Candidatus Gallimonas intestinavium TaxID=2838603 RepID=A0A9D2G4E4_9FIRM|nr:glycosyl hydrolase 115 family protein [Candidatus Gallimonas intestinavium]
MQEYWRESVEQNAAYEVSFTLGMRGIHDSGFRTRAIDENAALSEKQKLEARVRLLEKVITDQREIIRSVLHHERPDQALQVFIPYKGVLPLYDAGLALPEDITVMWTNDNFGHIRRYPSKQEQMRKGGHALYFHSSYWAPAPLSYLFINSIPLAQTGCELRKAYENGIRKIWVDNVGALKPLEQDMEYFLAFGWDAARAEALVHHIHEYLVRWFNEQFSGNFGEECARIYEAYAQITNVCKVEHLYRNAFSQTAYGDEASRRVNRLKELYSRVCRVHDALPADERDAFFELLGMKVSASYFINAAFYYADRSRLSYRQGKMQCADEYLHLSRRMMGCKRQMLYFYNHRMAGGKWKGILTPEAFPPPASCIYTDAKPALSIGETAMASSSGTKKRRARLPGAPRIETAASGSISTLKRTGARGFP